MNCFTSLGLLEQPDAAMHCRLGDRPGRPLATGEAEHVRCRDLGYQVWLQQTVGSAEDLDNHVLNEGAVRSRHIPMDFV